MSSYASRSLRARSRTFRGRVDRVRNAVKNWWVELDENHSVKHNLRLGLFKAFDVVITGTIIWYVVTHQNFLSYGLLSALAVYYFDYVVRTIKT